MLVWVIGSGGLLGSAVRHAALAAGADAFNATPVDWHDTERAAATLGDDLTRLGIEAAGGPWAIAWCAGSTVVASDPAQTQAELTLFTRFVAALAAQRPFGPGAFFLASSAGGLYAGAYRPPFDASTRPHPISPYGDLKWSQEQAATSVLGGRVPVVVGRLSNLYGPGQDPSKGQGLVPLLCRATMQRRPLNLYVSMDTVRDYLYVEDAGRIVWRLLSDAVERQWTDPTVEVIASGQWATVAEVVATVQSVAHRRVPLALGTHHSARHQVTDLRVVPSAEPGDLTPLPIGIKRVLESLAGQPV